MKRFKAIATGFFLALLLAADCGAAKVSAAPAFTETVTEAEAAGIAATPADQWKQMQMASLSGGAAITTSAPGAAIEFDFNGAAVAADLIFGVSGGMISVSVDGAPAAKIDLYRNRLEPGAVRVTLANNLNPGPHKLRIEFLADHHPKSVGSSVAVDTLRVADMPYASISGVLECRYNTGMPVMRAKISIDGAGKTPVFVTDTTGEFVFDALAPGTYVLHFEHPGFAPLDKDGLTVDTGKRLDLGKVLLEENIGARPLTSIRSPLPTRPVIVRPGDDFAVEVAAPAAASGWQASLESPWTQAALTLKNAAFDTGKSRWILTVSAPDGTAPLLYGLRLKFSGGEDFQPRAVDIVPSFKDNLRILHLTDVHVYKAESLFDKYRRLAEEVNLINPDIVVVTGDLTNTNGYTDERWPESDQYPPMLDLWNSYVAPTFIVAGNHDLSPYKKDDDYQRWLRFFDVIDFSFDVGPYHFTAFDDNFTMTSALQKDAFREDLFPEQLAWIESDLSRSSAAKMRILLCHVPIHSSKSKVVDLAAKYDAKLALYGHVHLNQVDKLPGTTYVQTGAAYEGWYRVVNLEDGKIGEISAKKDGFTSFAVGTLIPAAQTSPDGRSVTVNVKNSSIRAFPGAAWSADMPAAAEYTCDGCTIAARYPVGEKVHVVFTFDIAPKGETTATLSAK